ncbi:aldo/keto reductase [Streptomyces rimosus]|uniref:aldo/keto reductase n=1 Tax=Streptomyces rimosus TaxID=1927 RepID=UPI0022771765|nr:aldo/keto reductase [Streptomyces rimosus]
MGAVQTEYSPWERHVEIDILPMICSLGATLIAYRPLGRGLLTGAARATTHLPPPGAPPPSRSHSPGSLPAAAMSFPSPAAPAAPLARRPGRPRPEPDHHGYPRRGLTRPSPLIRSCHPSSERAASLPGS